MFQDYHAGCACTWLGCNWVHMLGPNIHHGDVTVVDVLSMALMPISMIIARTYSFCACIRPLSDYDGFECTALCVYSTHSRRYLQYFSVAWTKIAMASTAGYMHKVHSYQYIKFTHADDMCTKSCLAWYTCAHPLCKQGRHLVYAFCYISLRPMLSS